MNEKRADPRTLGARCKWCPFAVVIDGKRAPKQPVIGEGPKDAYGIIIGESPGREEADRGRPFVGSTGRELDDIFLSVGLKRFRLFIVNAIACRPPIHKTLADMKLAAECCRPALLTQLETVRTHEAVFAAGKWAFYSLTGSSRGMKNGRGFLREWDIETMRAVNAAFIKKMRKKWAKKKGGKA
jgi:uracil-DNA glycosylase family 4